MSSCQKQKNQIMPGVVLADTKDKCWSGVNAFSVDWQPVNKKPFIVPKKTGLVLGYRFEGAIKSRYKLGDDKWRTQECRKGEFMIVRAHEETQWSWRNMSAENDSLLTMILNLEQSSIDSVVSNAADMDHKLAEFSHRANQRDHFVSDIFKRLHVELMNDDPLSGFSVDLLKQELIVHLLRRYSVFEKKVNDNAKGLSKEQLHRVNDYVRSYCAKEITLKELADLANMSEYHFSRQYKKASHISPYQYILDCRFEKAQQLLETTTLTIQEIALEVGYKDSSTFSKAFRKHFGVTAANYRKQILS